MDRLIEEYRRRQHRRVVELLGHEPGAADWAALDAVERDATRRRTTAPWYERWLTWGALVVMTALLGIMIVAGIKDVEKKRAAAAQQAAWQQQVLDRVQALADDVRRLREALEAREPAHGQ